jgi:prophage regulatory protein
MADQTTDLRQRRIISKPTVLGLTGFSAATLGRKVRAGTFPAPVQISTNRVGWRESEVADWLDDPEAWLKDPQRERAAEGRSEQHPHEARRRSTCDGGVLLP